MSEAKEFFSNHKWECDHCGKRFDTRSETHEHEINCKHKPVIIKGIVRPEISVWDGFKLGIGIWLSMIFIGLISFLIATIFGFSILRSILG